MNSSLYSCRVGHTRLRPARHHFTARLFMFYLDLDELDELHARLPLFSRNRFNAYTFADRDHLFVGQATIRENLTGYLQAQGVTEPVGRVRLLTNLRVLGYVFNPVSFYVCDDLQGAPLAMVVEVHNTFGELKPYLLTREHLLDHRYRDRREKHFYISPFSELDHDLELRLEIPDERLNLQVINWRKGEDTPFFAATLNGERAPLTTGRLLSNSLRFPFVTLKIMFLIHWHAFRLWRKKVPFHPKSAQPELQRGILPKAHQAQAPVTRLP
ncbi:MAG: DUF1365 domain-containing protein [Opitutales bacterium]|nr:DUF1365 domain-containing protein [Opitutales bacterium]